MRGGKREGAGRPVGTVKPNARKRQVNLRLTDDELAKAELMGSGNASAGLREALRRARPDGLREQTAAIGKVPSEPARETTAIPPKKLLDLSAFSNPAEDKPRIRAAEGSEHDPIVAYGVEIWPAESPSYSFDEAWAAYQFWKSEDKILSTSHGFEPPQARGRHFMSQSDSLDRIPGGFGAALSKIAVAQYNNPESHEDCCCPHQQINVSKRV